MAPSRFHRPNMSIRILRPAASILALLLAVTLILPNVALAQSAPANLPGQSVYGRMGIPGDTGPGQAIPFSKLLSKGLLDQYGTTPGSILYRGGSAWTTLAPSAGMLVNSGTTPSWLAFPVSLAKGGSGQITAALARTSAGFNIDSYTGHGDSVYTIASTDRTVGTSATLTAARSWTMPAASAVNAGQEITVADFAGGVSSVNTLTIQPSGSDTINGGSSVVIRNAFDGYRLRSDGVSKWSAATISSGGSSSLGIKTPADYGAACDGTTDDSTSIQSWLTAISGNAFIGLVPAGKTCIINALFQVSSGTTIYGYGATLKLKNSGAANSGFVCGPTTQLGGPIDGLTIYGLTLDGNRTNQTNSLGSGAGIYCPSASNVHLERVRSNNWRSDGLYFGGSTAGGGQGLSNYVTLVNVEAVGNYRNNMSIVGLQKGAIIGGKFNSAGNSNNNGPQCGIDFEPDGATSTNTEIQVFGVTASGNGTAGFSAGGGSGICVFGASSDTSDLLIYGINVNANLNYGLDTYASSTPAQIRVLGVSGTGNGTSLYHAGSVVDWLPATIKKGAADGCGSGFSCVGVPN